MWRVKNMISMSSKQVLAATLFLLLAFVPLRAETDTSQEPSPVFPNPPDNASTLDSNASIQWKPLFMQSLFFIGTSHAFRLATEPGTREALKGPFFKDYASSLGGLHGWSDGDPFYVNYIGHPMEGAVAGFLFVQNDPKYKRTEFGRSSAYWRSRLRALGYSWVYSEQFEIGPASEASIGNIQARYPEQGFVDHVITPTIGFGWMVAEDAMDRYVIKAIEARTNNRVLRLMARSWLSPSRSYANLLGFRRPWDRDTRPGVSYYAPGAWASASSRASSSSGGSSAGESFLPSEQGRRGNLGVEAIHPRVPAFEVTAHYDFFRYTPGGANSGSCSGGGATGVFHLNRWLGAVIDVSGCKMGTNDSNVSGDSLTYLFGPRFSYAPSARWTLYLDLLLGGNKLTQERFLPEKVPTGDLTEWNELLGWQQHALVTESSEANALAMAVGGGLDLNVSRSFAIRMGHFDYLWTRLGEFNDANYSGMFRFTTGAVLKLGQR